jgi:hypothetical protein
VFAGKSFTIPHLDVDAISRADEIFFLKVGFMRPDNLRRGKGNLPFKRVDLKCRVILDDLRWCTATDQIPNHYQGVDQ